MMSERPLPADLDARLREMSAAAVGPGGAVIVHGRGEVETLPRQGLGARLLRLPAIVCNQQAVARRAGLAEPRFLDVLELFAFIRPAAPFLPTPRGLAAALRIAVPPHDLIIEARLILEVTRRLIADLVAPSYPYWPGLAREAAAMAAAGWPWASLVAEALAHLPEARREREVWDALPEWEDEAPPPPPGDAPVSAQETAARLAALVGRKAEDRADQRAYAVAVADAFAPPLNAQAPLAILAEAGTGIGKTLGYIAPASLWAEKNKGAVWLATYTKNLQRQLDQELARLHPEPKARARKVVIRKGRENYLCLLNLEERSRSPQLVGNLQVMLSLVRRWARYSRDGDMIGGDFPAWIGSALGMGRMAGLTDRRGECIYSACAHYRKCFIERAQRKSRHADLVVANHAVVMVQAVRGRGENETPRRIVFDEGHHLFDAADSAFAIELSGAEAVELRRWLRGNDGSSGRARGLQNRVGDLVADDEAASAHLRDALAAALGLPADGWLKRLQEGDPWGPAERFFAHLRLQVHARATRPDDLHGLEAAINDPVPGLTAAAVDFADTLRALARPLMGLSTRLLKKLDAEAETLDTATRNRIESTARAIARRVELIEQGWRPMLEGLGGPLAELFCDWFSLERAQGREIDIGMHRHWIDPTRPFAEAVLEGAHGVVVTSATLRDHDAESTVDDDWQNAEMRTGLNHLVIPPKRAAFPSPFDYPAATRVFVVTDVGRAQLDQVAAAYRELFLAAGGGALGIFTAIARLKAVYERIEGALDAAGLALYAQHVTPMDTGSLVDIFRDEEDSCLLGTDAVRDGVDVPGRALRLIVFDRVPWPRPTILHRVRRDAFGGRHYDDMLTRLRIKQAYGRLVRRAGDRGVFIMLDAATPSRLLSAFPPGVEVKRLGLADAIAETRAFLSHAVVRDISSPPNT